MIYNPHRLPQEQCMALPPHDGCSMSTTVVAEDGRGGTGGVGEIITLSASGELGGAAATLAKLKEAIKAHGFEAGTLISASRTEYHWVLRDCDDHAGESCEIMRLLGLDAVVVEDSTPSTPLT